MDSRRKEAAGRVFPQPGPPGLKKGTGKTQPPRSQVQWERHILHCLKTVIMVITPHIWHESDALDPPDLPGPLQGILPAVFILEKQGPERCLPKEQDRRQRRCHCDQGAFLPIPSTE